MFATAFIMVGLCANAKASILGNLVSFDGSSDTFEDASVGLILKGANNSDTGQLQIGDKIQGLVHFNNIDGTADQDFGGSIWAAYAFVVASVNTTEAGGIVTSSTFTLAGDDVLSVLGVGSSGNAVDGRTETSYLGRTETSSIVILENKTSGLGLGSTDGDLGLAGNIDDSWSVVLSASLNNYIASAAEKNPITGEKYDLKDLSDKPSTVDTTFANFYATFNVTGHSFGSSTDFLDIYNPIVDAAFSDGGLGEISIADGSLKTFNSATSGEDWDFADDGNYLMNPVPEPSTIAIWAALGLGGCGFVARRRMKAKKA